MPKIELYENKKVKFQNVLCQKIDLSNEELNFDIILNKMQSYIKVNGTTQMGPLIQYTRTFVDDNEELKLEIVFMLQCRERIFSVEKAYRMESIIRIQNCMYCRYIGPEEKLKFAYDKINLKAFENDINLTGESYTVFVDQNEEEGRIIADVFMPRVEER